MDSTELYRIVQTATGVHRPDAPLIEAEELVDMHFFTVAVDRTIAEGERGALIAALATYDDPERLAGGPSYIEAGAVIGDQGIALRLYALGKVLGLWEVITPGTMGITGNIAHEMAGMGFVMMSGYRAA